MKENFSPLEKHTCRLVVQVTPKEKRQITRASEHYHLNLSAFVRFAIFNDYKKITH